MGRFPAALEPLRQAGKPGAILLKFPQWFPISRARKDYIVACAARTVPGRVCVEFRNRTWMTPRKPGRDPGALALVNSVLIGGTAGLAVQAGAGAVAEGRWWRTLRGSGRPGGPPRGN